MTLPYPLRVDLQYSGIWNNITSDVFCRDDLSSVVIHRGRQDEDSSITTATCDLSLNNKTGKYSPRNPSSPLYGLIGRNTQIRVGLGVPPIAASNSTAVSSSNLIAPSVTAEVTGLEIAGWIAQPAGDVTLPAGYTASPELDGTFATLGMGYKASVVAGATGAQTATFSTTATGQATINVHIPGGSFSSSLGVHQASGHDCNLTPVVSAGQTLIALCAWSEDQADRMTCPKIQGDRGLGWVLLADSGAAAAGVPRIAAWSITVPAAPGEVSFVGSRDGGTGTYLRLYTLTGVSTFIPRFVGEVAEFPVLWNLRGSDVWSPISAAGVTRRLGSANQASLRSAIYESFIRRSNTIAYWPMEDSSGATSFSSALPNGLPAAFVNTPVLAAYSVIAGSDPLPTFTAAAAIAPIGPVVNTGSYAFGAVVHIDAAGDNVGANILSLDFNGGDVQTVVLEYGGAALINLKIVYSDGTATTSVAYAHTMDGNTFIVTGSIKQTTTNVTYGFSIADITTDGTTPTPLTDSAAVASKALGTPVRVNVGLETGTGATLQANAPAIGHVFVVNDANTVFNFGDPDLGATSYKALVAWNNQKVSDRIFRLCADNKIRVNVTHLDTDEQLGNQLPNTVMGDLQEAEDSSAGGMLNDAAGFLGLNYRGRISKESQTPRITLDYSAKQISDPLRPVDDDQAIHNDVTVNRVNGGSGHSVLSSGTLSVQSAPNGVGPYRQTYDLSLFTDAQTVEQAQWRMHMGTIDEARWPEVTVEPSLALNSAVVAGAIYLDLGDVVRLTNLPNWAPRGPVDLILEGYSESFSSHRWMMTGNFGSASGYRVITLDDAVYGRLDAKAANLQTGCTSTATAILVSSLDSTVWITTATRPGDFPFDILCEGERMTVTAITGTSLQTFSVTRSINGVVKAHSAGRSIVLADPMYVGL